MGARGAQRLLVLGAGPAQLGVLAAARRRELYVIAVDRDPDAPGFRYADRRALVSVEDEQGIERLARAESVDGIIAPGIDWPVAIAARVAQRLALPHALDPETAVLTTSKVRQRVRLVEAGVPQPEYVLCASPADAAEAADRLGYPCVVKAPDRQGQRGLSLVAEPAGVAAAVSHALAESRNASVLVEELVPGRELTVNAFSLDGRFHALTVTDRVVAEPPAFGVALAHAWPSELPPRAIAAAIEAARRAAAALGVHDGPTYTQVIIADDGAACVGEVAARVGGGHDAELCRVALDVDLNGAAIAAALGEPVRAADLAPRARVGGACVRFLVARPGVLRRVGGLEEASEVAGVRGIRIYRRQGHRFGALRRAGDRAGAILAVGDSRDGALAAADHAAKLVKLETVRAESATAGV